MWRWKRKVPGAALARGGEGGAWAEDAVAPEAAVAKTRKK
jgi:hypothetical protein